MKNVLLVGGAGYVGSVLTSFLLKKSYKVTVLDNFIYQNYFSMLPYLGDPDFTLIKGDLCNTSDLEKCSSGITDVIILGGLVGDPITKNFPNESETINDKGIKTCIDFFDKKGIDKLIFISTCSNYGLIKENELADENFILSPLSLYAKAKVSNEIHLLSKKGTVDYTGVVFRFATAFGLSPRMRFDLTISEFTRDLFYGNELLVFDEDTWRPYCHIRDFCRLLEMALQCDKSLINFEVFNAGGDVNNYTKKMIVNEIINYIPEAKIKYSTNGSDPRNYRVSFKKVKDVLGFEPKFTVKDGILELIHSLKLGFYNDSIIEKNKYGNFKLENY